VAFPLTFKHSKLKKHIFILTAIYLLYLTSACKKIISIPEPVNSITTEAVFAAPAQANSAMAAVYANLSQVYAPAFVNGAVTIYAGLSADELLNYGGSSNPNDYQFYANALLAANGTIGSTLWPQPYFTIYQTNAILSGVEASTGLNDSIKNELTGEALFIRAFSYFYLVNLFGDVPLVLTIDYNKTSLLERTPAADIYKQITTDLKQAQALMRSDYSYSLATGERIIPNKWAATALLARVYLFLGDYADAYTQSNAIISNSASYSLTPSLLGVFNANSTEAIWQLKQNTNTSSYNATEEGSTFIVLNSPGQSNPPNYYLSDSLLSSFEAGDQRYINWVDSTNYNGVTYYFPYKYNVGLAQTTPGATATQYYMVLRLAEQLLIRAECEVQGQGAGVAAAIADINIIRSRAGLAPTSATMQTDVQNAIVQERRIELFAEWGHRWLDLKRWGSANTVLSNDKGSAVLQAALLYPIPVSELIADPNLKQNAGYQ
jgi:hypothetical protein